MPPRRAAARGMPRTVQRGDNIVSSSEGHHPSIHKRNTRTNFWTDVFDVRVQIAIRELITKSLQWRAKNQKCRMEGGDSGKETKP